MKNTIILFLVPPKFFVSIVFNFSWDLNQESGRSGRDEKRAANSGGGGGGESNKALTPIVLWLSIPLVYFFRPLQFGRSWLCFCRDTAVADLTEFVILAIY